jgi:hypothetical protein
MSTTYSMAIVSILTPLDQIHRVSRQVDDVANFLSVSGQYVQLLENERVQNVEPVEGGVPMVKMNISLFSDNIYESNDTRGQGRVTCMENVGVRVKMARNLYFGSSSGKKNGTKLIVKTAGDNAGFLHFQDEESIEDGSYPAVAVLEGISGEEITIRTIQQETVTIS